MSERVPVREVSGRDAFTVFDNVVRHEMGITGAEFMAGYAKGVYALDPDSVAGLPAVLMVLPFAGTE